MTIPKKLKSLTAVVCLALFATHAAIFAADVLAAGSHISNGNFETDKDGDKWPDGWAKPKSGSYETENGNHFLRLTSDQPGQMNTLYRLVVITDGVRALSLTWRQRITDLKPGKQVWFDARIMLDFKDAAGNKVKGAPAAPSARKDTDGWVERSIRFLVPEGAKSMEFMPTLFQVERGSFDLDDIVLQPTDAAPLEEEAKAKAAAKAEEMARAIEKRQMKAAASSGPGGELLLNGDFQTEGKKANIPDKWGELKGDLSWEKEATNPHDSFDNFHTG